MIDPGEVSAFLADLSSYRDRAIVLAMLLGGLRAGEVRGLLLANVDMGMGQVRVVGKGGRERVVPVDAAFFAELGAYLREERPAGCRTAECFVVLRGPTTGMALTEAGMRSVFRTHRQSSGAVRVRPHRLQTDPQRTPRTGPEDFEVRGIRTVAITDSAREDRQPHRRRRVPRHNDKVDALYDPARQLPADAIGPKMARLRREHRRLLGNGYCTRPPELDCAFENICETCTFFQTSIEFRPTLQAQHDDATTKGQHHRADLFGQLLTHLTDSNAS